MLLSSSCGDMCCHSPLETAPDVTAAHAAHAVYCYPATSGRAIPAAALANSHDAPHVHTVAVAAGEDSAHPAAAGSAVTPCCCACCKLLSIVLITESTELGLSPSAGPVVLGAMTVPLSCTADSLPRTKSPLRSVLMSLLWIGNRCRNASTPPDCNSSSSLAAVLPGPLLSSSSGVWAW